MSSTAKKLGNEEITKEFEIPKEFHNYSPTDTTNVISLKNIGLDTNQTTAAALPKPSAEMAKVIEVLHHLVTKTSSLEKRLLEEMGKNKATPDLTPVIKKTILDTVSLSTRKLQQEVRKNTQAQQNFQKSQLDNLKSELIPLLKSTSPEHEAPKVNVVVDVPNLGQEIQSAREVLLQDMQKLSREIQNLAREKAQLENYVTDLRSEFDEKEKGLKDLDLKRKDLLKIISDLEEEIRNFHNYLDGK